MDSTPRIFDCTTRIVMERRRMIVDLGTDHNSVEELSAREDDRKVRSEGRRSIASLVLVDSHLNFL
jgi:hypothetical protein